MSAPGGDGGEERELERHEPLASATNDWMTAAAALLSAAAGVAFAVTVQLDTPVAVHGSALAVALFALAFAVRRYFAGRFPLVERTEPRHIGSDSDARLSDIHEVPRSATGRRSLIGAAVVLVVGLLAPLAALGPRPRRLDQATAWREGVRLLDQQGSPIPADDVPTGGVATVWPEGSERSELSAAILVVLESDPEPPTNLEWVVDGRLVVYSKVCTHMGCPVGLFQSRTNTLFCPCHQASFNAARGARRVFGPVPRPLPQLPLGVDGEGYLIALGDFPEPVGPTVASS